MDSVITIVIEEWIPDLEETVEMECVRYQKNKMLIFQTEEILHCMSCSNFHIWRKWNTVFLAFLTLNKILTIYRALKIFRSKCCLPGCLSRVSRRRMVQVVKGTILELGRHVFKSLFYLSLPVWSKAGYLDSMPPFPICKTGIVIISYLTGVF